MATSSEAEIEAAVQHIQGQGVEQVHACSEASLSSKPYPKP